MRRTFLALTVAALASFAAGVHADDGAALGSTVALPQARQSVDQLLVAFGMPDLVRAPHHRVTPANVVGNGTIGEPCHAERPSAYGGTDVCNNGKYEEENGDLFCGNSLCSINCHKDEKSFRPRPPVLTVLSLNNSDIIRSHPGINLFNTR
jgi:hypothetical protein